jgi:hypothetical protein
LGKYADQFQRRLRNPREPGRDHWTTGGLAALTTETHAGRHRAGRPQFPAPPWNGLSFSFSINMSRRSRMRGSLDTVLHTQKPQCAPSPSFPDSTRA